MAPQTKRKQQKSSITNLPERVSKPVKTKDITPKELDAPKLTLTSEQEQQFESELCWCIEQLQTALSSGKLNNKQIQDHTKALNILMNNNNPIIKKRQVMRTSFGDYRNKMSLEEKKNKVTMKFAAAAKPSKKSVFIKKAHEEIDIQEKAKIASDKYLYVPSDNKFRFNFTTANDLNT